MTDNMTVTPEERNRSVLGDPLIDYVNDIPASLSGAYAWTSQSPERRFAQTREEYAQTLAGDLATFKREAASGGTLDAVEEAFNRYREGLRKRWVAAVASDSRCASSFITGPSNFPARRMQKRSDIASRRWSDLFEWRKRAVAAIIRDLRPDLAPIMAGDPDATERLQEKIAAAEQLHARMKGANVTLRRVVGALQFEARRDVLENPIPHRDEAIAAVESLGFTAKQAHDLTTPDYLGRIGFPSWAMTNNSADIRRLKQRLAKIQTAQNTPDSTLDGEHARFEDCPADNRVRLFFPGKPDQTTRTALGKNGFRWTPSLVCWQAYRHPHTIAYAMLTAGVATEQ